MKVYRIHNTYHEQVNPKITPSDHLLIALSPQEAFNIAERFNLTYANRPIKSRKIVQEMDMEEAKTLNINILCEQNNKLIIIHKKQKNKSLIIR